MVKLVPKLPVGLAPKIQLASGKDTKIYVGEGGPVTLDGDCHLDVEIADASVGATGLNGFREQLGVDADRSQENSQA